jgi:hypothetical protein
MMHELERIGELLNARTEGAHGGGAVDRVASVTLSQLGFTAPAHLEQHVDF